MNLSVRLAGLFATTVFLLTAMPGFFKQIQPYDIGQMANETISGVSLLETLMLSVGGAVAAGIIGYIMGDILTHPDIRKTKKKIYIKKEVKTFDPTGMFNLFELQPDSPLYEPPPEVPNAQPPLVAPPAPANEAPPAAES